MCTYVYGKNVDKNREISSLSHLSKRLQSFKITVTMSTRNSEAVSAKKYANCATAKHLCLYLSSTVKTVPQLTNVSDFNQNCFMHTYQKWVSQRKWSNDVQGNKERQENKRSGFKQWYNFIYFNGMQIKEEKAAWFYPRRREKWK